MNNVVVLDACTIVNLARIDEGDFLEDRVRTHRVFAIEEVLDEVKKHYVPSDKASKRQLHVAPYWGGLTKLENKDVEELLEPVRALSNYSKRANGELYSSALSLYLSRMEEEKVLFYTDDYPAKSDFRYCFEYQQMGYIGDSVDLLLFLYWTTPQEQFSKEELEKYLSALRGEYASKLKELQNTIDKYASKLTSSKKEMQRRYQMEGLVKDLKSRQPLTEAIKKCQNYFKDDKSALGKEINMILGYFKDCPIIVEKVGETLQNIEKYGIYRI